MPQHFIANAARFIWIERFVIEAPSEVFCLDIGYHALPGNQREEVSASSVDFNLIPAEEYFLHPVIQADVERRVTRIAEDGNVREGLIQATTKRADNEDLLGFKLQRA